MGEVVYGYKAFDSNLEADGMQFKIGGRYCNGPLELPSGGFEFCENPMDIFRYSPIDSRICKVVGAGKTEYGQNQVRSTHLKVLSEITIEELIVEGIKYNDSKKNDNSFRLRSDGAYSIAIASDSCRIVSNDKFGSVAIAFQTESIAATNFREGISVVNEKDSVAISTGYKSMALAESKGSIACALGYQAKAKAQDNGFIIIAEYKDYVGTYHSNKSIHKIHIAKVGEELCGVKIEPNILYWFEDDKLKSNK